MEQLSGPRPGRFDKMSEQSRWRHYTMIGGGLTTFAAVLVPVCLYLAQRSAWLYFGIALAVQWAALVSGMAALWRARKLTAK